MQFATRYHWDRRPAECLSEPRASAPECVLDSWPTLNVAADQIAVLYRVRQFPLLERALGEVLSSDKRFSDGRPVVTAGYLAFRRMMAASRASPRERDTIASWKEAIPQSYFAVFAEARFLYASAWAARGSGYSSSVSKEAWELFAIRMREAEQVLLNAPQQLKETPWWHELLLSVSLDSDAVQSDPRSTFERAVAAWPEYYDFLLREGATPDQTRMNWATMKRSFADLIARYPDRYFKNLYASYACFARDKAAFGEAMRALPVDLVVPANWLPGHSYDACLRWAGT